MLGTMWINTGLALLACVVTFIVAMVSNVWLVSLERAGFAFLLFFLAAFPIRWLIGAITRTSAPSSEEEGKDGVATASPMTAATEEQGIEGTEASDSDAEEEESFTPLTFSRQDHTHLAEDHTHLAEDPTTVAEVIRRLSDE